MSWTPMAKLPVKITEIKKQTNKKNLQNFMKQIFLETMYTMMYFYIFSI